MFINSWPSLVGPGGYLEPGWFRGGLVDDCMDTRRPVAGWTNSELLCSQKVLVSKWWISFSWTFDSIWIKQCYTTLLFWFFWINFEVIGDNIGMHTSRSCLRAFSRWPGEDRRRKLSPVMTGDRKSWVVSWFGELGRWPMMAISLFLGCSVVIQRFVCSKIVLSAPFQNSKQHFHVSWVVWCADCDQRCVRSSSPQRTGFAYVFYVFFAHVLWLQPKLKPWPWLVVAWALRRPFGRLLVASPPRGSGVEPKPMEGMTFIMWTAWCATSVSPPMPWGQCLQPCQRWKSCCSKMHRAGTNWRRRSSWCQECINIYIKWQKM